MPLGPSLGLSLKVKKPQRSVDKSWFVKNIAEREMGSY